MPNETSLKFVRVFYGLVRIVELLFQIGFVFALENLNKIADKKILIKIEIITNYVVLFFGILGILFVILMNIWPKKMFKIICTIYFCLGVNEFGSMILILSSITLLSNANEKDKEYSSIMNNNIFLAIFCVIVMILEFVCFICVERQIFLLKKFLNTVEVQPDADDIQAIENEISNANEFPPSYEEAIAENVDPPPPQRWVRCESVGVALTRYTVAAAGCIFRNQGLQAVQSNEINTTQESNLHVAASAQENQSSGAEPPLESASPDVDFASSSLVFRQETPSSNLDFSQATTLSSEDQAPGATLREELSEAISLTTETNETFPKDVSKKNADEETTLSQEKTITKKSLGKSNQKTSKGQEEDEAETDFTKPEENKQDN